MSYFVFLGYLASEHLNLKLIKTLIKHFSRMEAKDEIFQIS